MSGNKQSAGIRLKDMPKMKRVGVVKSWMLAYTFLAPALILICMYVIYPAIRTVFISLHEWNGLGEMKYVGLKNFEDMFMLPKFWQAVKHTFAFSFGGTLFSCLVGLMLALAIERRVKGWKAYKFVFYISVMLSSTVVAILFTQILEPNYGIFNKILEIIGLEEVAGTWLANPKRAMGVVVAISVWQYSGFTMLLFLASMEGIDPGIQEAATIDGVSEVQRIFYITLPMIKRTIFVVVMLQIIFTLKCFDQIWVLTAGGPGGATETLTTLIYYNAMRFSNYGDSSAIAVFMIVVVSVISIFYLKASHLGDQVNE